MNALQLGGRGSASEMSESKLKALMQEVNKTFATFPALLAAHAGAQGNIMQVPGPLIPSSECLSACPALRAWYDEEKCLHEEFEDPNLVAKLGNICAHKA